jgi:hypothetical protein
MNNNNIKAWQTRHRQQKQKGAIRLFIIAWIAAGAIAIISPTITTAADGHNNMNRLPRADNKQNLTDIDSLLIASRGYEYQDYLVRLAFCESRINEFAINSEGNSQGVDRGILQINSYYHKEVSDACAFNIECATAWTISRIDQGHQDEWACDRIIKN